MGATSPPVISWIRNEAPAPELRPAPIGAITRLDPRERPASALRRELFLKEPFRTIYFTLKLNNFQTGKWTYGVKIARTEDAIYIGDDSNHLTVLSGTPGYHHTEYGNCANGQHEDYTTIADMLERVRYNPGFYTNTIVDALEWLEKHKTHMG
jgi:hypothetical protein